MALSDLFKTFTEMTVGAYFIVTGQELLSGTEGATGADGTAGNRPLGQLAANDNALMTAMQSQNTMVVEGGGTLAWTAPNLSFSSDITLRFLSELGSVVSNVITTAGESPISLSVAGTLAYVLLDREADGASLTVTTSNWAVFLAAVTGSSRRLDYFILAYRSGTDLILFNRMLIPTGSTSQMFLDGRYSVAAITDYAAENRNIFVYGTNTVMSFVQMSGLLAWDTDLLVHSPQYSTHTLVAGNVTLTAGQAAYFTWTFARGSNGNVTLTVVAIGSVPTGNNVFVFALRLGDTVFLWNGQSVRGEQTVRLGGATEVVTELKPDSGSFGKGSLQLSGGNNITTVGTSPTQTTINCDITNVDDLADVTAGMAQGFAASAAQTPGTANALLTAAGVNHVLGFEQILCIDTLTVNIGHGALFAGGEFYPSWSTTEYVTIDVSDLEGGGSFTSGIWYYIYAIPGATPGSKADFKFHSAEPTLGGQPSSGGAATWRCIGSAYATGASTLNNFVKQGTYVKMHRFDPSGLAAALANFVASGTTLQVADLTGLIPETARGYVDVSFRVRNAASPSVGDLATLSTGVVNDTSLDNWHSSWVNFGALRVQWTNIRFPLVPGTDQINGLLSDSVFLTNIDDPRIVGYSEPVQALTG